MSKLLSLIVAALFAAASVTAIAQDKKGDKPKAEKSTTESPKKQMTEAQKARNKECAAQANEKKLKGDERKKFMSGCVKPAAKTGAAKTGATKTDSAKTEPKKSDTTKK
jgi:Ni/Co efflux regulator RcnB